MHLSVNEVLSPFGGPQNTNNNVRYTYNSNVAERGHSVVITIKLTACMEVGRLFQSRTSQALLRLTLLL